MQAHHDPRRTTALSTLRQRSEAVCDAEMERLSRRVPALTEAQQRVVREALDDLAEQLLLSRARCTGLDPALVTRLLDVGAGADSTAGY